MSLRATLVKPIALGIGLAALAVPTASASTAADGYVDLRSADAKAASIEAGTARPAYVDLRSPDAKAASIEAAPTDGEPIDLRSADAKAASIEAAKADREPVDLRSPDAKAASIEATARGTGGVPASVVDPPAVSDSNEFSWRDAGIGAGAALLLAALALGAVTALRHRSGDAASRPKTPATAA